MIAIKKPEEIKILREGGKILASILYKVADAVKPGIATIELDSLAEKLIKKSGGLPSFKNYKTSDDRTPYPASLCVSINDEVVHGIPSKNRILNQGDIIGLDLGMQYKKFFTDMAITVPVGKIDKKVQDFIRIAHESLNKGIDAIKEENSIGDISFAIQNYVQLKGFNVVRNLVGHGVGYAVHEEPEIPNFGIPKTGEKIKKGMVLALEPMITEGDFEVILDEDKWTWKTKDGLLSAHFEHTLAVSKNKAEILTKI